MRGFLFYAVYKYISKGVDMLILNDKLLLENDCYFLLENNFYILLEDNLFTYIVTFANFAGSNSNFSLQTNQIFE